MSTGLIITAIIIVTALCVWAVIRGRTW